MRAARPARVFDADGREVWITMTCTRCHRTGPLRDFGLRRMGDGKIRSIPQCKVCRGRPGGRIELVVAASPTASGGGP